MPTSNQLIAQIKKSRRRLRRAENDLGQTRGQIILGPMDIETPWSEDASRVKAERENIEELIKELGNQVLRERG